jgi:hypothetical protein
MDNVLNDQWSKWQEELGDKALPNGFNTFPINVMGPENDYLLGFSTDNCPVFGKAINDNWGDFEKSV